MFSYNTTTTYDVIERSSITHVFSDPSYMCSCLTKYMMLYTARQARGHKIMIVATKEYMCSTEQEHLCNMHIHVIQTCTTTTYPFLFNETYIYIYVYIYICMHHSLSLYIYIYICLHICMRSCHLLIVQHIYIYTGRCMCV